MTAQDEYEATYPADVRSMATRIMTEQHRRFMSMYLCDAILAERKRCATGVEAVLIRHGFSPDFGFAADVLKAVNSP